MRHTWLAAWLALSPLVDAQEADLPAAARQELARLLRAAWGGEGGRPLPPALARQRLQALQERVGALRQAGRAPLRAVRAWWEIAARARTYPGRVPQGGGYAQPRRAGYRLWVPPSYRADRPWPLVVCLPPRGLSARAYLERFWLAPGLRDAALLYAPERRDAGPTPTPGAETLEPLFAPLAERILRAYNVDRNAVFLDAAGDAGPLAWEVAVRAAPLLAGLIFRAAPPPPRIPYGNLRHVPLLFFRTEDMWGKDPVGAARRFQEFRLALFTAELTVESNPATDPTDPAQAAVLPGTALPPSVRLETLAEAAPLMAPAVRSFLARRRRNPYPRAFTWTVLDGASRRAYWVRSLGEEYALREDLQPWFRVRAVREANRVEIESRWIRRLEVRLNDRLLALDRPVTIRVNGRRLYYGQPRRSLALLLRHLQRSEDWTDVFPVSVRLDIPVP